MRAYAMRPGDERRTVSKAPNTSGRHPGFERACQTASGRAPAALAFHRRPTQARDTVLAGMRDRTVSVYFKDGIAGAILFAATAAVVVWQNSRLGDLWDLGYVLEQAYRISLGQVPYRDFPLAYAPLSYAVQAAIIKVTGTVFWHHVAYCAVVGGLGTLLTWRIVLRLLRGSVEQPRLVAFLLSAPLIVLGIYCIYPGPNYGVDCTFAILASILMLLYVEEKGFPNALSFLAGVALVVPAFIKQNMGLAFLGSAALAILALLVIDRRRAGVARGCGMILCGIATGLALAALLIQVTAGVGNYLHWTVHFAAERRLHGIVEKWIFPPANRFLPWWLGALIAGLVLLSIGRKNRLVTILAVVMLSVPFVWISACLLTAGDQWGPTKCLLSLWPFLLVVSFLISVAAVRQRRGVTLMLPFIVICTILGALLALGVLYSTFALWPLAIVLIASALTTLQNWMKHGSGITTIVSFAAALSLLVSGAHYVWSNAFYVDWLNVSDGRPEQSALGALRGLTVRGAWLPQFDQLAAYAKAKIPAEDGLLVIPGEDLFYYATGREPRFPVLMFDRMGNPYSPEEIAVMARAQNIRWLVVKRQLQEKFDPVEDRQRLLELLRQECKKTQELDNYDIYQCVSGRE